METENKNPLFLAVSVNNINNNFSIPKNNYTSFEYHVHKTDLIKCLKDKAYKVNNS